MSLKNKLYATASKFGLVRGGFVPGSLDETPIQSGYIGQYISVNLSGTPGGLNQHYGHSDQYITIPPGIWAFIGAGLVSGSNTTYGWAALSKNYSNNNTELVLDGAIAKSTPGNAHVAMRHISNTPLQVTSNTTLYLKTYASGTVSAISIHGFFIRIA